jgi:hypothetical protein
VVKSGAKTTLELSLNMAISKQMIFMTIPTSDYKSASNGLIWLLENTLLFTPFRGVI